MRVISVDPGGDTGIALWDVYTKYDEHKYRLISTKAVKPEEFYKIMREANFDLIIYEDYKLFPQYAKTMSGNDFISSQLIGVMKSTAYLEGIPTHHNLSNIKPFWTDDLLRHLNLYVTIDHRRDAIRHFLQWFYLDKKYGDKYDLLY